MDQERAYINLWEKDPEPLAPEQEEQMRRNLELMEKDQQERRRKKQEAEQKDKQD